VCVCVCVCVFVSVCERERERGNCEPEAILYSFAMEMWTKASIRWFDTKKKKICIGSAKHKKIKKN